MPTVPDIVKYRNRNWVQRCSDKVYLLSCVPSVAVNNSKTAVVELLHGNRIWMIAGVTVAENFTAERLQQLIGNPNSIFLTISEKEADERWVERV